MDSTDISNSSFEVAEIERRETETEREKKKSEREIISWLEEMGEMAEK